MLVARATKEENRADEIKQRDEMIDEYFQNASSQNTTLQLDPISEIPRNTYIWIYSGAHVLTDPAVANANAVVSVET